MKPPFPRVIDSTMVAAARSCHEKLRLEFFEHWKSAAPSVHLVAGAAYAAGLEAARRAFFEEGHTPETSHAAGLAALMKSYGSFECPPDSAKSLERTMGALEFYLSQYPLETELATPITLPSGKRGIEFSAVEPIDILHPETGDPILYSIRADQIVDFQGGVFIEDDKTTSQLGASWPRQWDLRSQFTAYCWGVKKNHGRADGVLVRGVSILKTKYDTLQAISYRHQWMIDRWYEQLLRDVKRMIAAWEEGYWDLNLDHACAEYGGCPFRQVCLSPPEAQATWLETGFERREWNPVLRTETKL